jgi:hypothetical protein
MIAGWRRVLSTFLGTYRSATRLTPRRLKKVTFW